MPTKKKDKAHRATVASLKVIKKVKAPKTPFQKAHRATVTPFQKQTQVVNVYTTAKRTARKQAISKAPVRASLGNTYYQPVSQAPNSFSLADVANLINKSQPISKATVGSMPYVPIPVPIAKRSDSQAEPLTVGNIPNKIPVSNATVGQSPLSKPIIVAKPSVEYENLVYTTLPVATEDLKLKKTVTKKPKKATLPLPKKTPAIQKPTNEAVIYNENPVVEERTLTLLPPPQEILRQIKEKNKPRPRLIIEDDDESENVVISTQPEVIVPKRVRRTKQQIDEAKQMKIEEIESRRNK